MNRIHRIEKIIYVFFIRSEVSWSDFEIILTFYIYFLFIF